MKKILVFFILTFIFTGNNFSQVVSEETAKTNIQAIKSENGKNSQVFGYISQVADIIGQRVTWSPAFNKSIDWAIEKFKEIGLKNSHSEEWEPKGKSWEVKRVVMNQLSPYFSNLIANPRHFSPGTKGLIKGKAVYLEARTEADLEKYKGKLKGALVFVSIMPNLRPNYDPFVVRLKNEELKQLEEAKIPSSEEKAKQKDSAEVRSKATLNAFKFFNKRIEFCMKEGAVAIVEHGSRTYGTTFGLSALLPRPLESIDELFYAASQPEAPATLPQILVSIEQYNSIIRALKNGIEVNLEFEMDINNDAIRMGKNVIAEILGSDLKNEVVIIGAHIDSQGPSVGATDNAAGVAVCMEAMRILEKINAKPRRTIRICLWGGEEQGYLGSKAYVKKHFVDSKNEKCYMYFNTDMGAGRFRGIYMEEYSNLIPVMKKWFDKIDMKLITCISKTGNTDHVQFVENGIPGFQFIQDALDYFRIYHTNMDRVERIPAEDINDNVIIMASLAYLAAIE